MKACGKAHEQLQLRSPGPPGPTRDFVFLKTGYEQVKVRYDDILYLEAAGNYVTFVLASQRLLSRLTIQEALELLPAEQFTRVHRSFIVANSKVDKVERHQLGIGRIKVPVGASYQPQVQLLGRQPARPAH